MKKILLLIAISLVSSTGFAQWATIGGNLITGTNVGIGTENPQSKLDVIGSISIRYQNYIGASLFDTFKYKDRSMGHYALSWMNDPWSGGSTLWQSGYGGIKFFTGGQYRMGINGAGSVGIGTDNPQSKLDVVGSISIPHHNYIGASLFNTFKYKDRSMGYYALSWMNDPWNSGGSTLWQSGYGGIKFFTDGQYRMGINVVGNVGIGTDNPQAKLDVNGNFRAIKVLATEVKIEDISSWSDFVFDKDYNLRSLDEVETHINIHKHLPDFPSEAQVKAEGVNVVEMQAKLLQKIEELTLYVIKQDKEINKQSKEIKELKEALSNK